MLDRDDAGLAKISRKLVRERAGELAAAQGRSAQEISKGDWEQAKEEMKTPDVDAIAPAAQSAAEAEQWDPVPGSAGHKVHVPSGDEEDDEGRSDVERLVVDGVRVAGREQREEAEREAKENA